MAQTADKGYSYQQAHLKKCYRVSDSDGLFVWEGLELIYRTVVTVQR